MWRSTTRWLRRFLVSINELQACVYLTALIRYTNIPCPCLRAHRSGLHRAFRRSGGKLLHLYISDFGHTPALRHPRFELFLWWYTRCMRLVGYSDLRRGNRNLTTLDNIMIIFVIQAELWLVADFDKVFWSSKVKARLELYVLLCCLWINAIFLENVRFPGALRLFDRF